MYKIAYFGGEPIGVPVLQALLNANITPQLVVCNPDRPAGRKHELTAPPVKTLAQEKGIAVFQPETISKTPSDLSSLTSEPWDLFVVVAYNKILPRWFIDLPQHKSINVHPSLLPQLRGASPIRSSILQDLKDECGASVMLLDEKMDHGPLLSQAKLDIAPAEWPLSGPKLDERLGKLSGELLAKTIPAWLAGSIEPQAQDHERATYSGKITKDMAELTLDPRALPSGQEAYDLYLKIQAYAGWPVAFFRHEGKRYKITKAQLTPEGQLEILTVIPEGKPETPFARLFT